MSTTPTPKPEVTGEERDHLVTACAQGVVAWSGIYGGADLVIRGLADLLGVAAEEAEALVSAEGPGGGGSRNPSA